MRRHALTFATATAVALALAPAVAAPAGAATSGSASGSSLLGGVLDPVLGPVTGPLDPVLGLLTPPRPQLAGPGSLTALGDYSCVSTSDAVTSCAPVLLDLLGPLQPLVLTAVPTPGFQTLWSGCPAPAGDLCTIQPALLTGLLTPLAQFVPLPGLPEVPGVPGLPEVPGVPGLPSGPGAGEPTTTLTTADTPPGTASALFGFAGTPSGVTFECRLDGPTGAHDWTACATPTVYDSLTRGHYTFAVRAMDGDRTDATPATHSWTATPPTPAPETRITRGPAAGAWVLTRRADFGYSSTVPGSTYSCRLDGAPLPCAAPGTSVGPLAAGTHTFSVAAVTATNRDLTPAGREFSVPLDDRALSVGKGWARKKQDGHFRGTYLESRRQGATLRTKVVDMTRLALVADKGRGFGTVEVYSGKRMIKQVRLASQRPEKQVVIPVASFLKPQTRVLRLVVAGNGRPVRIDGLAVRTGS